MGSNIEAELLIRIACKMKSGLLFAAVAGQAYAATIGEMAQGAEFTKCIKITDYNSKTLADDVTLVDRNAVTGCCPAGNTPGIKHYNSYWGAQIECGWKDDGTVSVSTGTTCNYGKCYVIKQDLECSDGTKQLLNGCCGPKGATTFKTGCEKYDYVANTVRYCLSYETNYEMDGTAEKTDDQLDGKLQLDKLYVYSPCAGSSADMHAPTPAPTKKSADGSPSQVALGAATGLTVLVAMVHAF